MKRVPSEVVVSPAPKRRCVQPGGGEEEEEEEGWEEVSQPSNSQRYLFEGLSFLLTMRRKEDRHLGRRNLSCLAKIHSQKGIVQIAFLTV